MEEIGGDAAAASTSTATSPTATATTTTTANNKIEDGGGGGTASTIRIKVSYGSNNYDVFILPQSTFADLKRVIAEATGLEPEVQTVLFRGKEIDDHEHLHMVGVKDNAKVVVMENSSSKDEDLEKVEETEERNKVISRGSETVSRVREENDQLAEQVQTVLFRGKEIDVRDHEHLHMVGMKDNAKVVVMDNSSSKDEDLEKVEETEEQNEVISSGSEAVSRVQEENDQLAEQVVSLEVVVCSGTQISDKDFLYLTEMLMRQLLKLDGIDAEGEGRVQRKMEVRRVQSLVEKMDDLRAKNSDLSRNVSSTGSVTAPTEGTNAHPSLPSSTKTTQEWQVFE